MPTAPRSRSALDLSKIDWRRIEVTSDAEIAWQVSEDPDTAPVFTADELLAASRRVSPADADVAGRGK